MALVTVDSSPNQLQLDSIPIVDLRFLSQSELNSLSLCSDDAFDLRRCDDVVIPKIDRSVFNESAGSRKQTYSRLRLAPRKPEITTIGRRRRCAGLLPISKPLPNPVDDPERKENKRIVTVLRELFARDNPITDLVPYDAGNVQSLSLQPIVDSGFVVQALPVPVAEGERRRKRGRKRKDELNPKLLEGEVNMTKTIVVYENGSNVEERSMEIVNRNGVIVDFAALANVEDPFGPELRRRTVGLETEADLLGFLRELDGQWGSRRKKRKIVDASDFGDQLPKGWKLLLALKRKEGRVWLNCRRYISPNGQPFVSCKEVSSYLHSYFGPLVTTEPTSGQCDENIHGAYNLASISTAGLAYKDDITKEDLICYPVSPITSISNDHERQVALLGVENLEEVQVRDLLECHKCGITFDEKDAYLQHVFSFHQRNAKRCRLGSSIADGVIIKDGKYECQFCHKTFQERHRYNGHVGVHVRNYVRSLEASPAEATAQTGLNPSSLGGLPLGPSKMDASVDIEKSFFPETFTSKPNDELNVGSRGKLDADSMQEISIAKPDFGSFYSKKDTEGNQIKETLVDESHGKQECSYMMIDNQSAKLDKASNIRDVKLNLCLDSITALINEETSSPETLDRREPYVNITGEIGMSGIEQEQGSENYSLTPSDDEKACDEETNVNEFLGSSTEKHHEVRKSGNNELEIGKSGIEQERGLENCSHARYGNEKICDVEINTNKVDEVGKPGNNGLENGRSGIEPERDSKNCSLTPSGNERMCDLEHSVNVVLTSSMEEPKLDEVGKPRNNELENGKSVIEQARGSQNCSLTPSANEKIHDGENNVNEVFTSSMVEPKLDEVGKPGNYELESVFGSSHTGADKDAVTVTISPFGNENILNEENNVNKVFTRCMEEPKLDERGKPWNSELECDFGRSHTGADKDAITETIESTRKESLFHSGVADSSLPLLQSPGCFHALNVISDKGEDEFYGVSQKLVNISGFDELKLDDIEPPKLGYVTEQESISIPEEPMGLTYDAGLEQGLDSSVNFEWEAVLPNMVSQHQLTALCVWCRIEFNHEAVNPEAQSDSVGFMCSSCKAKISGQLNVLDNGLSGNSDHL